MGGGEGALSLVEPAPPNHSCPALLAPHLSSRGQADQEEARGGHCKAGSVGAEGVKGPREDFKGVIFIAHLPHRAKGDLVSKASCSWLLKGSTRAGIFSLDVDGMVA